MFGPSYEKNYIRGRQVAIPQCSCDLGPKTVSNHPNHWKLKSSAKREFAYNQEYFLKTLINL